MNQPSLLLRRAVLVALALSAAPVTAQETEQTQESGRSIETIVVTAQKREQNLQDVPIVVTAVSEQLLQDTGVKDIKDLHAPDARPDRHLDLERDRHHRAHPRHRHGRRQPRPGILGRRRHRRRLPAAQRRRLRRPRRARAHRGAERPAGHAVRQEHLGRRHQRRDRRSRRSTSARRSSSPPATTARWKAPPRSLARFGDTVAGRLYVAARERDGYLDVDDAARARAPRTRTSTASFYTARGQLLFKPSERARCASRRRLHRARRELLRGASGRADAGRRRSIAVLNALQPGSFAQSRRSVRARRVLRTAAPSRTIKDKGASAEVNWDLERPAVRRSPRSPRGATGKRSTVRTPTSPPSTSCTAIRTATSATSSSSSARNSASPARPTA